MRLVHFDFNNNFGGAPQSMVDLARRLAARHEVHMVDAYGKCEAYAKAIADAGLPYHVIAPNARHRVIGGKGLKRVGLAIAQTPELLRLRTKLARTISNIKPDAIWVMNGKSLTFAGTAASLRHIPIAHMVRGWGTPDQMSGWLRRLLIKRVAAIMAVSSATAKQLVNAGLPDDRIHTIYSTINKDAIAHQSQLSLDSPPPGMNQSPRLLLLSARPERAKGHPAALRAIARLVEQGQEPALWIPGSPPVGSDQSELYALHKQARDLEIEPYVHFLGWRDDIPQLIQACDICLLPSHTEGLPRAVLEAMFLKRPVIATKVGGIPDAIIEGQTGHIMPIDDDAALADHVLQLTRDAHHRDTIVSQASEHLHAAFDPDQHTQRVERIFEQIITAGAPA